MSEGSGQVSSGRRNRIERTSRELGNEYVETLSQATGIPVGVLRGTESSEQEVSGRTPEEVIIDDPIEVETQEPAEMQDGTVIRSDGWTVDTPEFTIAERPRNFTCEFEGKKLWILQDGFSICIEDRERQITIMKTIEDYFGIIRDGFYE